MLGGKATLGPGPDTRGTDIKYELPFMLITVMGTGTRFFTKLLLDHYRKEYPTIPKRQIFYAQHCVPHHMDQINELFEKGTAIITTVRDWNKVEKTFEDRFVDPTQTLEIQRELWKEFILPNASVILSVDQPDRDSRIVGLNHFLNAEPPLTTNWEPVGANKPS